MRSLFCIIFIIGVAYLPASSQASLLVSDCNQELNDAVAIYNRGDAPTAKAALTELVELCEHLPQIQHNLGVIAVQLGDLPQAHAHFNKAIADDARTNMTLSHIQAIHQHQASLAYQKAMDVHKEIELPQLQMQDASVTNTSIELAPKTSLHNLPTVEYELFSWWTSAAENDREAWLEHYLSGYPAVQNTDTLRVNWNRVQRDISFTAQDAVVVLSYSLDDLDKRTLLLLRLQNNRWKIYREAAL